MEDEQIIDLPFVVTQEEIACDITRRDQGSTTAKLLSLLISFLERSSRDGVLSTPVARRPNSQTNALASTEKVVAL